MTWQVARIYIGSPLGVFIRPVRIYHQSVSLTDFLERTNPVIILFAAKRFAANLLSD